MTRALQPRPRLPPLSAGSKIAAIARTALLDELNTWPKPGLVSHIDQGSHSDMDAGTFEVSADAVTPFFGQLFEAGAAGAAMPELRQIGVEAETAMMAATGGINTHRGAIFGLGLFCAAAGALWSAEPGLKAKALGETVQRRWGDSILRGPIPLRSHGVDAWRRFGAGGARAQAASGFPYALEVGLPALRRARLHSPHDAEAARAQAFFALLAVVEDTNLLHRGGREGLSFAQDAAQAFLSDGGVANPTWRARASTIHDDFIVRRLSPGGCADLLAVSLFLEAVEDGYLEPLS
jgi:triphosphoribosyl-dephospho-CoA synthase